MTTAKNIRRNLAPTVSFSQKKQAEGILNDKLVATSLLSDRINESWRNKFHQRLVSIHGYWIWIIAGGGAVNHYTNTLMESAAEQNEE